MFVSDIHCEYRAHTRSKTSNVTGQTSHVTRHTSHVTCTPNPLLTPFNQPPVYFSKMLLMNTWELKYDQRYTSHVTRHTSHATRHTSHAARHSSHVTRHTSHITRHTSHVSRHTVPYTHPVSVPYTVDPRSLVLAPVVINSASSSVRNTWHMQSSLRDAGIIRHHRTLLASHVIITWAASGDIYQRLPGPSNVLLDLTTHPREVIQAWLFWLMMMLVMVMWLQEFQQQLESATASSRRMQLQKPIDQLQIHQRKCCLDRISVSRS